MVAERAIVAEQAAGLPNHSITLKWIGPDPDQAPRQPITRFLARLTKAEEKVKAGIKALEKIEALCSRPSARLLGERGLEAAKREIKLQCGYWADGITPPIRPGLAG